ncbi:hypothetical protein EV294_101619 [Paenibacillus sp. BK033]|nr:hypothetical protein [Paenibacillus sp. BK720]TCN01167.1 hypothetical protein EV294_101619 [Paenibacillus sp. BK033]
MAISFFILEAVILKKAKFLVGFKFSLRSSVTISV